ncbi:HIT domain-containing protein [Wenyingzhuangia sp. chi5]|uniref:HIT domain-containing protein n=1 Tax=Wenyingzhuangia gilva TaxID=3057677 RepID=A0ABT8VPN1_9FLAO|nr:HIT domain-containing protein [Wenyingzhuangia sp. chi5]MDO3693929.1 HIT domain-containing protein [Wenyingzhuangia sp. chi5]
MSIFTKIIKGEIPSYKIAENDDFFVFLDINPNAAGHTLVVPKKEVDKLFDLEDELYTKLFQYSKTIAAAVEKAVPCKRVGLSVIGLEVPHVHVHLIPLNQMADATFGKKEKLTEAEFKAMAEKIASFL